MERFNIEEVGGLVGKAMVPREHGRWIKYHTLLDRVNEIMGEAHAANDTKTIEILYRLLGVEE